MPAPLPSPLVQLVDIVIPELEQLRVAHTVTIVSEMFHNFQVGRAVGWVVRLGGWVVERWWWL